MTEGSVAGDVAAATFVTRAAGVLGDTAAVGETPLRSAMLMVGWFGVPSSAHEFTSPATPPAASTPIAERLIAVRVRMSREYAPSWPCVSSRHPRDVQHRSHSWLARSSSSGVLASVSHTVGVHVLLVEDDIPIAVSLVDGLTASGYRVTHVATGAAALAVPHVDVVLLDLGLPDMDGRDVCRELRARGTVPIIMLTARGDEFDRVLGLELGADDYVTKPFSFRELEARMRAVTRRVAPLASVTDVAAAQVIGPLEVDRRARRVRLGGVEVALTAKEFDLLAYLAVDPGAVCTRTDILEHVWDVNWYGPTKTVDAHVAAIRKKLGDAQWIEAVRGVGFRLGSPQ